MTLFMGCVYLQWNGQVTLFLCTVLTAVFARLKGYSVEEIENMVLEGIRVVAIALVINVCIGMLISAWIASGTLSFFVLLSARVAEPRFYLVEAFICCCVVSSLIGSCWICAGTVGLALFYIAQPLQVNPLLLLGAIVGGCRFGACVSPISDSANISRILSGIDNIYVHIRGTCSIAVPAAISAAVMYLLFDLFSAKRGNLSSQYLEEILEKEFNHHIVVLFPILVLCILIYQRRSTLVCLLSSISVGGIVAVLCQGRSVRELFDILFHGYGNYIQADNPLLRSLLSRGGITSMANVLITLIIGMSLSGILTSIGVLNLIVNAVLRHIKSPGTMVLYATLSSVLGYGATGDSQPAKVLVSNAFSNAFEKMKLNPSVLSRAIEMSSFGEGLFPWTVGGVYLSGLFGVSVSQYWYCIFFYYFMIAFNLVFQTLQKPYGK